MNNERLIGLAHACQLFHSGQSSRGYRLLCKIDWRPGTSRAAALLPRDEFADARTWAAHYIRLARNNPRMF